MRVKRLLAFALAVIMLMSNTVTASATSSSNMPEGTNLNIVQNDDGSYTVLPTEVLEEEDDELSNEDDEIIEDDELSDGDLDNPSGEEGQEPDESNPEGDPDENPGGNLDNSDTNPEANPDANPENPEGDEGGDSTLEPENGEENIEQGSDDEISVSENSVSENSLELPLMLNEVAATSVEGDETRDAGENVQLYVLDPSGFQVEGMTFYFSTIASAVDKVDAIVNENNEYAVDYRFNIMLLDAQEGEDAAYFSVSGSDMVTETNVANCALYLSGHSVNLTGEDGNIVTTNIDINGWGNATSEGSELVVASGVTLQILESFVDADYFADETNIDFFEIIYADSNPKLIIGENDIDDSKKDIYSQIHMQDVKLPSGIDLYVYEAVQMNIAIPLNLGDVVINLDEITVDEGGYTCWYSEDVYMFIHEGGSVTMDNLSLKGELNVQDSNSKLEDVLFTVEDTLTSSGASMLNLACKTSIKNIDSSEGTINLCMEIPGTVTEGVFIPWAEGSLDIPGNVLGNGAIYMNWHARSIVLDAEGNVSSSSIFDDNYTPPTGTTIITLSGKTEEEAKAFNFEAFVFSTINVNTVPQYDDALGCYKVVASGASIFQVYNNKYGIKKFATVDEVTAYMTEKNDFSAAYIISLLNDYTLPEGESIDFTSVPYGSISFELNRNTLTISEDTSIQATYFMNGYISVAKDATLTFLSAKAMNGNFQGAAGEMCLSNIDFRFDEESTSGGLVLNSADQAYNMQYSSIRWCTFENVTNVSLDIHGNFAYENGSDAEYLLNGCVDSYEKKDIYEYALDDFGTLNLFTYETKINGQTWVQNVSFYVPVNVTNINLNGRMRAYALNVDNLNAGFGSYLALADESQIFNLHVVDNGDYDSQYLEIEYENIYKVEGKTKTYLTNGMLTVVNILTSGSHPYVLVDKVDRRLTQAGAYDYEDGMWYYGYIGNNEENVYFNTGETILMVYADEYSISQVIPTVSVMEKNEKCYYLAENKVDESTYELKAYPDVNDIRVYDSCSGITRGFTSFSDVKEYIADKNNPDAYYSITINKNITLSDEDKVNNALSYNDELAQQIELNLNNHTITLNHDYEIRLNVISNGKIKMGKEKLTLTILGRTSYGNININDTVIESNATNLIIGNEDDLVKNQIYINYSTFKNAFANMKLYGRVKFNECGSITVSNDLVLKNYQDNNTWQFVDFCNTKVTTKNLYATDGILQASELKSTGTTHLSTAYTLFVLPGGTVTLANVNIINPGEKPDPYSKVTVIYQYQDASDEGSVSGNSVSQNAIDIERGMLNITGTVSTADGMLGAFYVRKERHWFDENGQGRSETVEFGNEEVIATASKSTVTPKYFSIDGEGRCTKKVGTQILADAVSVRVHYNGYMDGNTWVQSDEDLTYEYYSLQDAVANMATDFGARRGEYDIRFVTGDVLSANVTLPAFVERAIMGTYRIDENDNRYFQQSLDLNGKTLTTSGTICLDSGLRIISNAVDTTGKNVNGKITSAYAGNVLEICEGQTLIEYQEGSEEPVVITDKVPALDYVVVTAKSGDIGLYAPDGEENRLNASFEVKGFYVDAGEWRLEGDTSCYLKATNLRLNGEWEENIYEDDQLVRKEQHSPSRLAVASVTINGAYAEIFGTLEADDVSVVKATLGVYNLLQTDKLTMDTSKVYVEDGSNLFVYDKWEIPAKKAAYTGEASRDYTVENRGQISAANISMPVGTFANYGTIEANAVKVKDFIAGEDTSLICNSFANTGKATFYRLGRLLVNGDENETNVDGTLNNVYLCGYDNELHDYALIGRATKANVTLTGTFTSENENQRAIGFISNHYEGAFGNEGEESAENQGWDRVWLSIVENIDGEGNINDGAVFRFEILDDEDVLFNTTISAFSVDKIRVLGLDYWNDLLKEKTDGKAVYLDGNSLKVIGEYINIYAKLPNGEWSHLRSFTNWKDASAYLNTLNSKTTTYYVEIKEDIDFKQKLELPANVKQIVFGSGKGNEVEGKWYPEKVKLTFQGDITLKTDTSFENIILDAYTLDKQKKPVDEYQTTIDTKGKFLALRNVDFADGKVVVNEKEYGGIKALKGTSTSYVHFVDTNVAIASKVSGIHEMVLTDDVNLMITGGLSVNNLIIDKFWDIEDAPDSCSVRVNGSGSTLEVKKILEMRGQTSLICDGKMKFLNVLTNVEGNIFSTAGKEAITITGVVGTDDMTMQYLEQYKQTVPDDEQGTVELIRGYKKTESETDYQVMKNAICILAATTPNGETPEGITVVTAEKVSPIWFAIQNPGYYAAEGIDVAYANLVHKVGKNHVSGLAAPEDTDIVLYADMGERLYLNSFGTLQDAFTEIDRIGGPDINFIIEVTGDDSAIVKGKLGNYTFPSKAAEVQIVGNPKSDANGIITLNYNNAMTLKSDVVFTNIELNPFTTNTITLGNYLAILENVTLNDFVKTSINGSGTAKGSKLIFANDAPVIVSGDITNVETLVLEETNVQVNGKISAGALELPSDEVLTCLGTIAVGDVYSVNGSIQTVPAYTWSKDKSTITKVSSNLTISGEICATPRVQDGELVEISPQLTIAYVEKGTDGLEEVDLQDTTSHNGLIELASADGAGITIAKAVNVNTDSIVFANALDSEDPIYKKAGSLVYKWSDPVACLQYVDSNGREVEALCETFADAVTEINNLKTKRDYTIGLYNTVANFGTLAMPNANYVDTLTICPFGGERAEIQYMNNITFTSNVVLENIDFIQVVKDGTEYLPIDDVKEYPSAVSVSVAGAYFVSIVNDLEKGLDDNKVTFNTPIVLNGNKKATLNIGEGVGFETAQIGSWNSIGNVNSIQGKITGFAQMNVFEPISLYGYSSLNAKKVEVYNATELNVTNLNVSDGAIVAVGRDALNCGDKVVVTNLNLTDATLETTGTGTFTNVVLAEGTDKLAVYGQTFTIDGTVTCMSNDAELVTGLTSKSEAALYVKGNVALGNAATDIIRISVTADGINPYVLGATDDKDVKNSTLLLKAKTADTSVFVPDANSVLDANKYNPGSPEGGYILKKTGENIQVYYGSEIGVALCDTATGEVINYYPTYNDAVAAIDALNNTNAEYTIVIIQNVGTAEAPVALSMPSKAAKVTVAGYEADGVDVAKETIYYTNAPALKTDMVFANVTMAPMKVVKKVVSPAKLGITTNNFDITLQDIELTGENAAIATITGKNTATVKLDSEGLVINGDITAAKEIIVAKNVSVTGSVNADAVTIESNKTATVNGKFTAKVLSLNGYGAVDARNAAVTITDINNNGGQNKIYYGQDSKFNSLLTIKGIIKENDGSPVILDMSAAGLKTFDSTNPSKIVLKAENKLATIEKEGLNKFNFVLNGATLNSSDYCWANKAVYRTSEMFTPIQIVDGDTSQVITNCLDFAEAVNFINTVSNKAANYVINLAYTGNYVDVNLTDAKVAGASAITMPGKDKAESVKIIGLDSAGTQLAFAGNITAYGDVTFENIWLVNNNASSFTITNKKDSDGDSSLTLIDTVANGKAAIGAISGEKNITAVTLRIVENAIYPDASYGAVSNVARVDITNSLKTITLSGLSTVNILDIAESKLVTTGKATVGTVNLKTNAKWEAKGVTTVTDIKKSKNGSYIGTFHSLDKKGVSTGLPQFTVTGSVTEPILVKLFNPKIINGYGEWVEIKEAVGAEGFAELNAKVKYATDYADQKLVLAKAESADKFIASDYGYWDGNVFSFNSSEQAYKNKDGYVSNGNITDMEVLLTELNEDGTEIEGTTTYVATYAEAIQVINTLNNKNALYQISLRNTTLLGSENGNGGVIKTALSGTNAAYGALALPAANKAASITIDGDGTVMKYTSGLKPNCDVIFKNITLTEGSLDKKGNYTALNYITPNVDADVTITFAAGVKTLGAENGNLVFNSVSGKKGEIAFADNYAIEAKGAIVLPKLEIANDKLLSITSQKAITITDIAGGTNTGIDINTYFTNKAWKKAATQLSINGSVLLGEGSKINVNPYIYDVVAKTYSKVTEGQIAEMLVSGSGTPAAWQKVITAPKMQAMAGEITLCSTENIIPAKYNGGIYFTNENMPIVLWGGKTEVVTNDAGEEEVEFIPEYGAYFQTWDEAVKEIDRIKVKQSYAIVLYGDLGADVPLKTLTMPSQASELVVVGEEDANGDVPDIMMTGTTITAKCNLAFDNVGITAVKKTGNNYYSVPYTLNTGNFEVEIEDMPDVCRFFVNNGEWVEERGQYNSEMKVSGSAKGSFTYSTDENGVEAISQISKVGTVILNNGNYYIPNGVTGVTNFMVSPNAKIDCAKSDFTVTNLKMGQKNSDAESGLSARNITVSGLLTMASSWMHAGTSAVGDGKVTLTNVRFQDNRNSIEGKQDKNGNSLIQIKGIVDTDNDELRRCEPAVTIGLYYNNSNQNYVRLSEGMNLLTAPKAESSWFRPNYGWYNEETDEGADNMGWEIGVDRTKKDNNGKPMFKVEEKKTVPDTEFVPIYGLYKSGNNIKYGQIRESFEYEYIDELGAKWMLTEVDDMAEARLWIGTDTPAWDYGESAYLDFMTFEEAVKAIDSLNQKDARYCIELLRTVELGNTAGNGKYSALTLPSKANVVTICGNGNSIIFAGNVSLKCNTVFEGVQLSPVKLVKNEVLPAEVNVAAGNFALFWNHSDICFTYQEEGEWVNDYETGVSFANITGSSKGSLSIVENSWLPANNVTGFGKIEFTGAGEDEGWLYTEGNVTATEICFTDGAKARLRVLGNVTVNAVYLDDDVDAQIGMFRNKTLKINGAQVKDEYGNLMKDENGKKIYDSVVTFGDEDLQLYTYEPNGTTKNEAGSKLVTGKYLDADDWKVYACTGYDTNGDEIIKEFSDYTDAAKTNLYLGKVLP